MSIVRISAEASADLDEIWFYIAKDSSTNADRFLDRLLDLTNTLLADHPRAGRAREEFGPGLRSIAIGKYLVFYTVNQDEVDIVRVIHGARDLGAIFGVD
jgi:toxin ParE1/3/4